MLALEVWMFSMAHALLSQVPWRRPALLLVLLLLLHQHQLFAVAASMLSLAATATEDTSCARSCNS